MKSFFAQVDHRVCQHSIDLGELSLDQMSDLSFGCNGDQDFDSEETTKPVKKKQKHSTRPSAEFSMLNMTVYDRNMVHKSLEIFKSQCKDVFRLVTEVEFDLSHVS